MNALSVTIKYNMYNWKLYVPIILLCFLRVNTLLDYIIYIAILSCFVMADLNLSILIYVCLLPWERMLAIPGFSSLISILQILFIIKIISFKYSIKVKKIEVIIFLYFSIIGVISFINYSSLSALMIPIEMAIIFFMSDKIFSDEVVFYSVINITVVSLLTSLLYALVHLNFAKRWVDGIGYVPLFRGVLESNETAFYCGLALFLVCIAKNSLRKKLIIMFLLAAGLFATVSLTGIALAIIALSFAFVFNLINIKKNEDIFFLSRKQKLLFALLVFIIAMIILNTDMGRAIVIRIQNAISQFMSGNIDKATSGRENLLNTYLHVYNELPLYQKIFGTGLMGREYLLSLGYAIQYPHNSFIELLFYEGVAGLGIIFFYIAQKLYFIYQNNKYNSKILMIIKLLTIIEGLSVTMSGYAYWTFWYLI